jgi:hypothetical protein
MPGHIRKSHVEPAHAVHPITNMVNKSLYVFSAWSDMKSLIKVTMYKHPNMFIKISSDREIRDVGVGATSRTSRGENSAEMIYNTLQDLMSPPHLVIVRLNELAYKNKAAPGFLEEALSYRIDRDMPTWLLTDRDKPFGQGCYAWSQSVWDIITTVFEKVDIPRISAHADIQEPQKFMNQNFVDVNEPMEAKVRPVKDKVKEETTVDSDDLASKYGGGVKKEKPERVKKTEVENPDESDDLAAKYGGGVQKKKFKKY